MSRGHGRLQQRLLAELQAASLHDEMRLRSTFQLAATVFDGLEVDSDGYCLLSSAQLVSVRRALRRLQHEGLVCSAGRHLRFGRQDWGTPEAVAAYRQRVRDVFGRE